MSDDYGRRGDERTRGIVDASGGDFYSGGFAPVQIVITSEVDLSGLPASKPEGSGFWDPRSLRFHDLARDLPNVGPERLLSPQTLIDFDAAYEDPREPDPDAGIPEDAPFGQVERITSLNRTTRVADPAGRVAVWSSMFRVQGSEDQRDAVAIAIRGPSLGVADEVDVTIAADDLNALGLPEGVSFHPAGASGGTGGALSASQPRVVTGGLSWWGQGPFDAAARVAREGGTMQQIRDAARAAAFGFPPPPFTPEGTRTRPPEPVRNAAGGVVPNNHPLGYVFDESADRTGLLGTFITAGYLADDVLYFQGREGEKINRLAMRGDAHVAVSDVWTGAIHYVPTDVATVPEGDGEMVKGWMMPDSSLANTATQVGQETCKLRPVIRVKASDITTRKPPPPLPPPTPPPPRVQPPPFLPPEEEELDEDGTRTRPLPDELGPDPTAGYVTGLPGDEFDRPRTGAFIQVGQPGAGGLPGPSVTAAPGVPGHPEILALPLLNQLVIGVASPTPAGLQAAAGGSPPISLGLPGGQGTGGEIGSTGFEGEVTFGLPGAPGGFVFTPQPQGPGSLTDSEAAAKKATRAAARERERRAALAAEKAGIEELKARAARVGGAAGRRMRAKADALERARGIRERRRQKREDYRRRKQDEADARRRRREERRRARRQKHEDAIAAARAAADAKPDDGSYGSVGYIVDLTDPGDPVLYGDGALAAQDELDRRRALSGAGTLGSVGANTATTPLRPMGSPGGPRNLEGWVAVATYAVDSLQVMSSGAFGGDGRFLNAPLNVIEVVDEARPTPSGSTLGQQIIAYGNERRILGSPPLLVIGDVHAEEGASVGVVGSGVLSVSRKHTGGGSVEDDERAAVFIDSDGEGDLIGTAGQRFTVSSCAGVKAAKLAVVAGPSETPERLLVVGVSGEPEAHVPGAPVSGEFLTVSGTGVVMASQGIQAMQQAVADFAAAEEGALALRAGADGSLYVVDSTGAATALEAGTPTTLGGLTDVDTTGATTGDVLAYDGSDWVAVAFGDGLVEADIGVLVQEFSARLDEIAALAVTDGNFLVANGSAWVAESGSTARTSLGLGTIATQDAATVAITGGAISGVTLTLPNGAEPSPPAAGTVQLYAIDGLLYSMDSAGAETLVSGGAGGGDGLPTGAANSVAWYDDGAGEWIASSTPTLDTLHITGKLTVDDLIDPTGLILTPQASTPSASAGLLWVDNTARKLLHYGDGTDDWEVGYNGVAHFEGGSETGPNTALTVSKRLDVADTPQDGCAVRVSFTAPHTSAQTDVQIAYLAARWDDVSSQTPAIKMELAGAVASWELEEQVFRLDGGSGCYLELPEVATPTALLTANTALLYRRGSDGHLCAYDSRGEVELGGASVTEFPADDFIIYDHVDTTKRVRFSPTGISTGTTRVVTIPNANGTMAYTSDLAGYQPVNTLLSAISAENVNLVYGDLLFFAAGFVFRLPIGSTGDVLTVVDGAPAWVAP